MGRVGKEETNAELEVKGIEWDDSGMATIKQNRGTPYSSSTGSITVATATAPAVANQTFYVTDVSGSSSNPTGTLTVYNGTTVLWSVVPGTQAYEHSFIQPLACSVGATCTVVTAGTVTAYASLAGFYLNNT